MENNDLQTVLSQGSFEANHASDYALATGYSAIDHPSEPNYVALLGGSTKAITADGVCCYTIQASNLVDRLEPVGLTWKAFAENATAPEPAVLVLLVEGTTFPSSSLQT